MPDDQMNSSLLELRNVHKHFPVRRGFFGLGPAQYVRAVDGVSLGIGAGETLSIVGESGCGKTTTARIILNLEEPTAGEVFFQGKALADLDNEGRKIFRSSVQAVFQDPWSSLNPRMCVRQIIAEPMIVNNLVPPEGEWSRVAELLRQVGLRAEHSDLYPHQFSGGQRQRIAIARALSINPKLIILDEPVSALDVSVRAQILNLLKDLQRDLDLSYVMIAHHLATVRHMSHRVAVMYLGQVVEYGPSRSVLGNPRHPYTKALYAAALSSKNRDNLIGNFLKGELPSPLSPPSGCRFRTRCTSAHATCAEYEPKLAEFSPGHFVQDCACVTEG